MLTPLRSVSTIAIVIALIDVASQPGFAQGNCTSEINTMNQKLRNFGHEVDRQGLKFASTEVATASLKAMKDGMGSTAAAALQETNYQLQQFQAWTQYLRALAEESAAADKCLAAHPETFGSCFDSTKSSSAFGRWLLAMSKSWTASTLKKVDKANTLLQGFVNNELGLFQSSAMMAVTTCASHRIEQVAQQTGVTLPASPAPSVPAAGGAPPVAGTSPQAPPQTPLQTKPHGMSGSTKALIAMAAAAVPVGLYAEKSVKDYDKQLDDILNSVSGVPTTSTPTTTPTTTTAPTGASRYNGTYQAKGTLSCTPVATCGAPVPEASCNPANFTFTISNGIVVDRCQYFVNGSVNANGLFSATYTGLLPLIPMSGTMSSNFAVSLQGKGTTSSGTYTALLEITKIGS